MSVYLKNNAVGLDNEINHLQEWLYVKLIALGWTDYECYGRAYLNKNPRVENLNCFEIPTSFKDYKEITMDDKHNATSFFYCKDTQQSEGLTISTVELFFNINLKKLFNSGAYRMDEEAILQMLSILYVNPSNFMLGETKRGTKNVYNEYNIDTQDRDNMSEFFVCSFELKVSYLNQYCN